jgi:hypothetical protein
MPEPADALLDPDEGSRVDLARLVLTHGDRYLDRDSKDPADEIDRRERAWKASQARDSGGSAYLAAAAATAIAYRDKGRTDRAEAVLARAEAVPSFMSAAWYRLRSRVAAIGPYDDIARAYGQLGQHEKAWRLFAIDLRNMKTPPDAERLVVYRQVFWNEVARALAQHGRVADALAVPDADGPGTARLRDVVSAMAVPERPLLLTATGSFCPVVEAQ